MISKLPGLVLEQDPLLSWSHHQAGAQQSPVPCCVAGEAARVSLPEMQEGIEPEDSYKKYTRSMQDYRKVKKKEVCILTMVLCYSIVNIHLSYEIY